MRTTTTMERRSSPWGEVQTCEKLPGAPAGVVFVSTAGHGGAFVPAEVADTMPRGLRSVGCWDARAKGWWFEEDCAVVAVLVAWPEPGAKPERLAMLAGELRRQYPRHADGGNGCGDVTRAGFHSCRRPSESSSFGVVRDAPGGIFS